MRHRIGLLNMGIWETLCASTLLLFATNAFSSTISYEYDLSGQLVAASYGGSGRASFTYDDAGNMTSQTIVGAGGTPAAVILLLESTSASNSSASLLNR